METTNFGEHLTIDGYGGGYEKLNNRELVFEVLDKLPELTKMGKLCKPQVLSAPDTGAKDPGGWSGFVIIAESHISIHTFPKRGFLTADVYTCKNGMEKDFILNYFKDQFGLKKLETNFIKRGKEYPAKNIV